MTAIAADHILARRLSIVGSIGVLYQHVDASKLLSTIGIDLLAFSTLHFLQTAGLTYAPLFALPVLTASVMGSTLLALGTAAGVTLLLLLDADFVPPPDLLRRLVPWMSDPTVAMTQARWGRLRRCRRAGQPHRASHSFETSRARSPVR